MKSCLYVSHFRHVLVSEIVTINREIVKIIQTSEYDFLLEN